MSSRLTETEKWKDLWFRKLSPEAKVLFEYIRDNCDIAGFWEIDFESASFYTGLPIAKDKSELLDNCKPLYSPIEAAFEELARCYLKDKNFIWIRNFLLHQKNLPLKSENKFHQGILKVINSHNSFADKVFSEIEEQIKNKGLCLGLCSPTSNSNSNSNSNSKGIVKGKFAPPTIDEVKKYIQENPELANIDAVDFFKGYNDAGWIDTQGKPIRNWKLKLRTRSNFAKDRNPQKPKTQTPKETKCFVCKQAASEQIQTGRGKKQICDTCKKLLDAAPNFKARGDYVIAKTKLEPSQIEEMILKQKAVRQ